MTSHITWLHQHSATVYLKIKIGVVWVSKFEALHFTPLAPNNATPLLHCISLHCSPNDATPFLHWISLHSTPTAVGAVGLLHCTTNTSLHCTYYTALLLHCTTLHCNPTTPLNLTALHPLHCSTMHNSTVRHCTASPLLYKFHCTASNTLPPHYSTGF